MTTRQYTNKQKDVAHPRSIVKTSEFLSIIYYLTAWMLQRFILPLPSPSVLLFPIVHDPILVVVVGSFLVVAGAAVIKWVHVEMHCYSQPRQPGLATTQLIQTGPFRLSRNPTYAAICLCIVPGCGLLIDNMWIWIMLPCFLVSFYYFLIQEEETYLDRHFGSEWRGYCSKTRRWI